MQEGLTAPVAVCGI